MLHGIFGLKPQCQSYTTHSKDLLYFTKYLKIKQYKNCESSETTAQLECQSGSLSIRKIFKQDLLQKLGT